MSRARSSTKAVPRASRHWSAARGTEPKRASARTRRNRSRRFIRLTPVSSGRARPEDGRERPVESWCRLATLIPAGVGCPPSSRRSKRYDAEYPPSPTSFGPNSVLGWAFVTGLPSPRTREPAEAAKRSGPTGLRTPSGCACLRESNIRTGRPRRRRPGFVYSGVSRCGTRPHRCRCAAHTPRLGHGRWTASLFR
jgi:hypothetical protein